jgi:hypothetical protein
LKKILLPLPKSFPMASINIIFTSRSSTLLKLVLPIRLRLKEAV